MPKSLKYLSENLLKSEPTFRHESTTTYEYNRIYDKYGHETYLIVPKPFRLETKEVPPPEKDQERPDEMSMESITPSCFRPMPEEVLDYVPRYHPRQDGEASSHHVDPKAGESHIHYVDIPSYGDEKHMWISHTNKGEFRFAAIYSTREDAEKAYSYWEHLKYGIKDDEDDNKDDGDDDTDTSQSGGSTTFTSGTDSWAETPTGNMDSTTTAVKQAVKTGTKVAAATLFYKTLADKVSDQAKAAGTPDSIVDSPFCQALLLMALPTMVHAAASNFDAFPKKEFFKASSELAMQGAAIESLQPLMGIAMQFAQEAVGLAKKSEIAQVIDIDSGQAPTAAASV